MPSQKPFEKQFINVGLTAGVNKKRDAHQLQNGELLTGDNIVYSAVDGQVTKRNGYVPIKPAGVNLVGAPFSGIGCRDNMEPVVLGTNSLARYNVTQNSSTALPIAPNGRLRVSGCGASSGKTTVGAAPIGASVASDGVKYAMVVWHERNSQNVTSGTQFSTGTTDVGSHLIFYGLQDLLTGTWVYPPQQFSLQYNQPQASDGTLNYPPIAAYSPQVRYDNGQFFLFYVTMYQAPYTATPNKDYRFRYEVNCCTITPQTWGVFFQQTNLRQAQVSGAIVPAPGTAVSYDVDISGGKVILAYGDPTTATGLISINFYTFANSAFTLFRGRTESSSVVQGQRFAVRANGPAANPYLFYSGRTVSVYSADALTTLYSYSPSPVYPAKPVDVIWSGTSFYTFGYQQLSTRMAGIVYRFTPSTAGALTYSPNQLSYLGGPVASFYIEYVSRAMFAPDGSPMIWLTSGVTSTDTASNATYLVKAEQLPFGDVGVNNSRVAARTFYLSTPHIGNGDFSNPCAIVQIPGTQKYVTFLTSTTEQTNTAYQTYGVMNRVQFDFTPNRPAQILPLPTGGNIIAGACPLYYDGTVVCEAGFSGTPDYSVPSSTTDYATIPGGVTIGGLGGLNGPKTTITKSGWTEYYYVTCFVRRDAYGNTIRSAPSAVLTVPITTLSSVSASFPAADYFSGSPGNASASGVTVEYYRTTANVAGTYYFVGQVPLGQPFVDGTYDSLNGVSITSNRTIYTNSGELPNDPPPACHHMTIGESRAFMIPSDARNVVWYSKQFSPGRTVEWCANLTISEGLNSGQFNAVQVLDSNVIVFKEDSIAYFYGTGPDNTGAGGGFSQFQKLATDVGCIDPGSIAVIPQGIVFRSRRGIELLNRSLQVQTIGDAIQPLVATLPEIVATVCMPQFTTLRFVTSDPRAPVLCLEYTNNRWSTFSGVSAKAAANMLGTYWFVSDDGNSVNQETPGGYLDNGRPVVMTLETAEIPIGSAGLQGWGRVYRMAIMGDFFSNHSMTLQFAYDHSSSYSDTVVFDTQKGLITGDSVYQFRLSRMPRQTMQSLRIRLQDSNIASLGQACAISNLVLETGSKTGLAHLSANKTL